MPIIVQKDKRKPGLLIIVGVVVGLFILIVVTYFLFFAEAPFVEVIAPPQLDNLTQVSLITLNPTEISEDSVYQVLETNISLPPEGSFERDNPFRHFLQ